jgi:predicted RNase H-like HicB family nuclease
MEQRRGTLVFRFTAAYVTEGGRVYCICNEAPVVGVGDTADAAYADVSAALRVYVESLRERGELEHAIAAGKTPCLVTVSAGAVTVAAAPPLDASGGTDEIYIPTGFWTVNGHREFERDLARA